MSIENKPADTPGAQAEAQEPAPLAPNDLVVILGALQNSRYTFDEHERVIRPLVYKLHAHLGAMQGSSDPPGNRGE